VGVNIDDVAAALGVSTGTVSRAITGHGRIAASTRATVLDYMAQHNYHPNTIAQSLSRRKTMNLAFTVPDRRDLIQMPFFLQCLAGARAKAAKSDYDILVVSNTDADVRRVIDRAKVDGVIVSRNTAGSPLLDHLAATDTPFVLIGTAPRADVPQIDHDHRAACRELTRLVRHEWPGRPGMIAGPRSHVVSRARAKGFSDAAPGAPVTWGAVDAPSVVAAFHDLRDAGVETFFCEDDMISLALLTHLRADGGVDDVHVASFYDSPALAALFPDVPVVHIDAHDLGARAAGMVLARIAGASVDNTLLHYELDLRGMTPRATNR
jgi:DNA-binding LacI/PurR family transcriptional regulator